MLRGPAFVVAAVAFALPHPGMAGGNDALAISGGCGDSSLTVVIPFDGARRNAPGRGDHCCDRIACHAVTERSKRDRNLPKR